MRKADLFIGQGPFPWLRAQVQNPYPSIITNYGLPRWLRGKPACQMPEPQEPRFQSLRWENLLEKEMATHSSVLAWRISWTEEPGTLQSTGSQSQIWLSTLMHALTPTISTTIPLWWLLFHSHGNYFRWNFLQIVTVTTAIIYWVPVLYICYLIRTHQDPRKWVLSLNKYEK